MNKGIIYIVSGQKYARWALRSVISLRLNGGESGKLPVNIHFLGNYVYEDQFNSLGCCCIKHELNKDLSLKQNHRKFKSLIMQETFFDKYVMIDADTYIQNDFIGMFDQIPPNGVAGIEDGNFKNYLQMAKLLFVKGKVDNLRDFVKECLHVDYGDTSISFPPYYNVGVIGWSKTASNVVGYTLYRLLEHLQKKENYNSHDEQLPINVILHHKGIPAIAINPIYNYTKSRLKKNIKNKTHKSIKDSIKIIHNKSCIESSWINPKPVEDTLKELIGQK